MVEPLIHVSAVVFRDVNDKVLTVRKRGTEKFMFPGGKPELGESALDTAIREVKEEIGIGLEAKQLTQIGVFEAPLPMKQNTQWLPRCLLTTAIQLNRKWLLRLRNYPGYRRISLMLCLRLCSLILSFPPLTPRCLNGGSYLRTHEA